MNRDSKGRFISSGSAKKAKKPEKKIFIEKEKPVPPAPDPGCTIVSITGDYQVIMNDSARAIVRATGDCAVAFAGGWCSIAEVTGEKSFVAISVGKNGRAKGSLGSWIACAEYQGYIPIYFKVAKVDGKTIKANTLYTLQRGKFVEVKD